jgi:hypothetical protein
MIHKHNLRGSASDHNFFVPRPLPESLKKSLMTFTLWNDIPVELGRTQSLAEFKSKIS